MGFFEKIIGLLVIPTMLVMLVVLASGVMKRYAVKINLIII